MTSIGIDTYLCGLAKYSSEYEQPATWAEGESIGKLLLTLDSTGLVSNIID